MSRLSREIAVWRYVNQCAEQAHVESSEVRKKIGLKWYLRLGDERLAAEELGRRIDDCLVEYINSQLVLLKEGSVDIEEFESRILLIEKGMKEDPDLKALASTLQGRENLPIASETYLKLARRHVLHAGRSAPSSEEGRRFVRVLLDPLRDVGYWETDWNIGSFAKSQADSWLDGRDPNRLVELCHDSTDSPLAWDTLMLICNELAARGGEGIPYSLLHWYFMAKHDQPKRPEEGSASDHRPSKLGYKLRDNEIRHAVDLLELVGMLRADACSAVEKGFIRWKGTRKESLLSKRRIQAICRKDYSTIEEFGEDAMKAIEPRYYSYLYGSEPDPRAYSST